MIVKTFKVGDVLPHSKIEILELGSDRRLIRQGCCGQEKWLSIKQIKYREWHSARLGKPLPCRQCCQHSGKKGEGEFAYRMNNVDERDKVVPPTWPTRPWDRGFWVWGDSKDETRRIRRQIF